MHIIRNRNQLTLQQLHNVLQQQLPQYEYKQQADALVISLAPDTQLNVAIKDTDVFLTEAVPVMWRTVGAVVVMTLVGFATVGWAWAWWQKALLWVGIFFASGFLTDAFYALVRRRDFLAFKRAILAAIRQAVLNEGG